MGRKIAMSNYAKCTDEQRTNDVRASRHPERESKQISTACRADASAEPSAASCRFGTHSSLESPPLRTPGCRTTQNLNGHKRTFGGGLLARPGPFLGNLGLQTSLQNVTTRSTTGHFSILEKKPQGGEANFSHQCANSIKDRQGTDLTIRMYKQMATSKTHINGKTYRSTWTD